MNQNKEITINDLARKLGVSAATVSRSLQNHPGISIKTKKKIQDLAKEMGYRSNNFARNLQKQQTNTIGVIVPRLSSYFMATVIAGMEEVANKSGYNLIISQSSESAKKEAVSANTMFNSRVDGIMVSLAYDTDNLEAFDPFIKKKIPFVFFDRAMDLPDCTNILIDNKKAAYEATSHLIRQGCKRLIHISAIPKRNVYKDRLEGFKMALAENNLPFDESSIITTDLSQESGETAAEQIQQMNPLPDGIFVANDNCAVGCMVALKKAGIRIPQDIAFVGFNNDPVSRVVEPNLTTINYPGYEMGAVAAQHLINQFSGKTEHATTNTIILRSELIIRESSGAKIESDSE